MHNIFTLFYRAPEPWRSHNNITKVRNNQLLITPSHKRDLADGGAGRKNRELSEGFVFTQIMKRTSKILKLIFPSHKRDLAEGWPGLPQLRGGGILNSCDIAGRQGKL